MIRQVKVRFPFNGMPKGLIFGYDPETDVRVKTLILAGVLEDVTMNQGPPTIVFEIPSIDSAEEVGDINGEGADQPSPGGDDDAEADDPESPSDLQGNQRAVPKMAIRRKPRPDISTDG